MKIAFTSVSMIKLNICALQYIYYITALASCQAFSLKVFLPLAPRSAVLSNSALYAIDQDAGRSLVPVDFEL